MIEAEYGIKLTTEQKNNLPDDNAKLTPSAFVYLLMQYEDSLINLLSYLYNEYVCKK